MLPRGTSYEDVAARFRWDVPDFYNIGVDVCDRWAAHDPDRPAIIVADPADPERARAQRGGPRDVSFGELKALSNRFANLLGSAGVGRGDRVAILLQQSLETAVAHIGAYKAGAIAIPLFSLFGPEALAYRLADSGARAVVTDAAGLAKLAPLRGRLPDLKVVVSVDGGADAIDWHDAIAAEPERFEPVATLANDPALIIYTSGTTGQPKGALHAHRTLLGHLPGVEMSHDLLPHDRDRMWTPADWAWIGGLLDLLMPALHHGIPVVARRFEKFTGEAAFELIRAHRVRNAFLPPTALKIMRAVPDAGAGPRVDMRTVASGGETLGAELLDWGRRTLGVTINEFYGQTECNMMVSSASSLMPARPGIMGPAVPGHVVAIVDEDGRELPDGALGSIAVRRPDPVMFLGYWNKPEATIDKYRGDWLITGDLGIRDEQGWFRFVGRDDDVITSSGYRIGPGEIEDCLLGHPAVRLAGVVGKPDPERTEIVKAFLVLRDGFAPGDDLARDIQDYVRRQLAAHEYPREIAFVDALPMTTTGKVIRRELRDRP